VSEPVTLINAFTVPLEESDRFLRHWKDAARAMSSQPGFIRARMHRALADEAELRFVNVAEWASGGEFAAAQADAAFGAAVQRMLDDPDLHVIARPALYQVAIDLHPGDTP
jgi:heme-degrading monooxygenase HmoA